MTADQKENLSFMRQLKEEGSLTNRQIANLSGYSEEYVRSWFAPAESTKFRTVPDRAVTIVKLKQQASPPKRNSEVA